MGSKSLTKMEREEVRDTTFAIVQGDEYKGR